MNKVDDARASRVGSEAVLQAVHRARLVDHCSALKYDQRMAVISPTRFVATHAMTLTRVGGVRETTDVMVVDGKEVFAGMTRFDAESRPNGARAIKLAGGLEALLVPDGEEKMDLRFSSGESIPMLKKKLPKQN